MFYYSGPLEDYESITALLIMLGILVLTAYGAYLSYKKKRKGKKPSL